MSVQDFRSRKHRSSARLAVMFAVGALAAVAIGLSGNWAYAPSLGWAAASLTYLVWVWSVIGRLSPAATAAHAAREDSGRAVSDALLLTATLASFGGVALILLDAGSSEGIAKAGIIAVALGSTTLSWFLVHTLFTLRYAFLYYRDSGGVDFNQDSDPRYRDFAYLAFTIGMTFQVSDTTLKTYVARSTALSHALLSYLLGTIVLATTINLIAGLIR
ncbi:DUF1345 domain-containing protein [Arthrobacter sp. CAU 1506]|uniref:DUF1345 domain-containing protein n=1 Tax=Arthrobacter sp. CAU 1506 TaxID=2560052 RepID=UPI0010ACDEC5|nr:DUF1345 domain-containing protein [Arthrobacter sp. CAU 1506]TJY68975.1 DUF1345 domain-containing protein [Arthrobacter sp. CAU 1506]